MRILNKKIFSVAITLSIILGSFCSNALVAHASTYRYGNVNNDNAVNSADALLVLKHSVRLEQLDNELLTYADVNGDNSVNSADALLILKYSVALISSFPVEGAVPTDKNEILKLYSDAVAKAANSKPSYTLDSITETKDVDVSLSGLLVSLSMSAADKAQYETDMEEETTERKVSKVNISKGTEKSANNLPPLCKLTDASTLKLISCERNEAGNYVISIKFKDEKNPKTNTSTIIKALGVPDYDTMKATLTENNEIEGITPTINSFEITYKDCFISCEINPISGEFVALRWFTGMPMAIDMSIMTGFNVSLASTSIIDYSYSAFGY